MNDSATAQENNGVMDSILLGVAEPLLVHVGLTGSQVSRQSRSYTAGA